MYVINLSLDDIKNATYVLHRLLVTSQVLVTSRSPLVWSITSHVFGFYHSLFMVLRQWTSIRIVSFDYGSHDGQSTRWKSRFTRGDKFVHKRLLLASIAGLKIGSDTWSESKAKRKRDDLGIFVSVLCLYSTLFTAYVSVAVDLEQCSSSLLILWTNV